MRVLFVSTHFLANPRIDVQGTYKRMTMFIDALKTIAQLDVLFYVPPETDISPTAIAAMEQTLSSLWHVPVNLFLCPGFEPARSLSKWRMHLSGMVNFFRQREFNFTSYSQQVQAFEACLDRQPDAIFIHRLRSMCPALLTDRTLPPIVFDLDDIEHIAFLRDIRQPPTRLVTSLYYLQVPILWRGERQAIQHAQQTYVCSEHDRQYLENQGSQNVVAVPNAVSIPQLQSLTREPTLLLLGAYHYYPNINAANFLIEQIWCHIHAAMPEARLIIAGKQPENIRSYTKDVPGVEFTGFVDDLDALYQRSRVVVCPILSGGGTRVKMVEAAAYGKPIVATRIGAEGLKFRDGYEFLQRDEPKQFAAACLELLQNQLLCEQLGSAARAAAIEHYDRSNIVQFIQQSIQTTLGMTNSVSLAAQSV